MKKRALFVLIGMMMLSLFSTVKVSANDIAGHWAKEHMEAALKKGYLSGFPGGNLKPDQGIGRAEFVKLVNHALNFTQSGEIHFQDVNQSDWFYKEVAAGVKAGYINGTSPERFDPNGSLTREQAAKILALAEKYKKADYDPVFVDRAAISAWAMEAVAACVEKGVLKGMPDGTFAPQRNLTRAEAVTILEKALLATAENPEDIALTEKDRSLQFRTYKNVEIDKQVGEGSAFLKQVRIKGDLMVRGGGKNTVHLQDVIIDGKLIVEKEDGQVRIKVSGESEIPYVLLHSGAILEEADLAKGFHGISRVDVTTKIAKDHEVIAVGEMTFDLANQEVKIVGNDKVIQQPKNEEKKETAVKSPAPAKPSVPSKPAPSPAPAPAPAPSPAPETNVNGDPKDSPVFIIDSKHSGLGIFVDRKQYNHRLVIKTVSSAAVYFVVAKSDNDDDIRKEQVLEGKVSIGEVKSFYILKTQSGVQAETVIHAEPGESIYLVATNADEKERLEKLDLATRVRIFRITK